MLFILQVQSCGFSSPEVIPFPFVFVAGQSSWLTPRRLRITGKGYMDWFPGAVFPSHWLELCQCPQFTQRVEN